MACASPPDGTRQKCLARPIIRLGCHSPALLPDLGRGRSSRMTRCGPKGFASVVYGLIVLESGIELADQYLHLTGLVEVISILTQSSTMS